MAASIRPSPGHMKATHDGILHPVHGPGPRSRRLLRPRRARPGRHLRHPRRGQLRPWRLLHARRCLGGRAPQHLQPRLLVGAPHRSGRHVRVRHPVGTRLHPVAAPTRPALQLPAHVRSRARLRRPRQARVRRLGAAVRAARRARWPDPTRTGDAPHVPVVRVRLLTRRLPHRLVAAHEDARRHDRSRGHRRPRTHPRPRHQRRPLDHTGVRLRHRARRPRGRARGTVPRDHGHDGLELHHHPVRHRGDRRARVDPRRRGRRLPRRPDRGVRAGLRQRGKPPRPSPRHDGAARSFAGSSCSRSDSSP